MNFSHVNRLLCQPVYLFVNTNRKNTVNIYKKFVIKCNDKGLILKKFVRRWHLIYINKKLCFFSNWIQKIWNGWIHLNIRFYPIFLNIYIIQSMYYLTYYIKLYIFIWLFKIERFIFKTNNVRYFQLQKEYKLSWKFKCSIYFEIYCMHIKIPKLFI